MDGFPTFLIDLNGLPVGRATLPLLMVSKGEREREVVEYVIEHHGECSLYVSHLLLLHQRVLEEVLKMRQMTPEEIGVDLGGVIRMFGEEKVMRALAERESVTRMIRLFGEEKVIQALGEERIVQA
ncbi:MAG TPA: hypothetical protein EYP85_08120, partial [Armatimonadetes bacterium]|nr:hypothetical protein [Armatimonadota bacterium]